MHRVGIKALDPATIIFPYVIGIIIVWFMKYSVPLSHDALVLQFAMAESILFVT